MQKQERRLTELSITDELTGLFNKRWFSEKIRSEVALSQQLSSSLTLMVIDVDHFKSLFDKADKALYKAKHSGRNRVISSC